MHVGTFARGRRGEDGDPDAFRDFVGAGRRVGGSGALAVGAYSALILSQDR